MTGGALLSKKIAKCAMRSMILCILSSCTASLISQSSDGHLEAHRYINTYFHYSYAWPISLLPRDVNTLNVKGTPSKKEFLMFAAQRPDSPFGVVMLAEHTSPQGIRDGNDFLSRVPRGWLPEAPGKVLRRITKTGAGGLKFEELDYMQAGEWNAAVTTQIGEYLIAFRCNARSSSELNEYVKSVLDSTSTGQAVERKNLPHGVNR